MRDGIVVVDADGHVMDRPHRCYQKYLPKQYAGRGIFFPMPYWDRLQAPNGPLLTTQLYFPGEAQNASDSIFDKQLLMKVNDAADGKNATFDFVVRS